MRAIRRVTVATAYLALQEGWCVVGPDPEEFAALQRWADAQHPFNQARLT